MEAYDRGRADNKADENGNKDFFDFVEKATKDAQLKGEQFVKKAIEDAKKQFSSMFGMNL